MLFIGCRNGCASGYGASCEAACCCTLVQHCDIAARSASCHSWQGDGVAMQFPSFAAFGAALQASVDGDNVAHLAEVRVLRPDGAAGTWAAAPEWPAQPPAPPAGVTRLLAATPEWPAPPQAPLAGRVSQGTQPLVRRPALAARCPTGDHHELIFHALQGDVFLPFALTTKKYVLQLTKHAQGNRQDEQHHPDVESFWGQPSWETWTSPNAGEEVHTVRCPATHRIPKARAFGLCSYIENKVWVHRCLADFAAALDARDALHVV